MALTLIKSIFILAALLNVILIAVFTAVGRTRAAMGLIGLEIAIIIAASYVD